MEDRKIDSLKRLEIERQNNGIELIASENYPSVEVRDACGSIFIAKYAEGYPGKRYYGGCRYIDEVEELARSRAKKLFGCCYANVQPHSGSNANFEAYRSLLNLGDKVLSLQLNDGGHLTHGASASFSSKLYDFHFYDLGEDGRLDYSIIEKRLDEVNPNLFLAGYSAYPFEIDFKLMRDIIDRHNLHSDVKTAFMVDMAHIAGIVAAKATQNPVLYADIVTSTTHKTLRGPRGGLILSNREDIAKKIDSAVFPYAQGGPLENIIAGKAIAFREDASPKFAKYINRVLENTKACSDELSRLGAKTSGTENHLFLLYVLDSFGIDGKSAQLALESIGITTNKNAIHGDKLPPSLTSGLRIGFAAATSRGCTKAQAKEIANIIFDCLTKKDGKASLKQRVHEIVKGWKDINNLHY